MWCQIGNNMYSTHYVNMSRSAGKLNDLWRMHWCATTHTFKITNRWAFDINTIHIFHTYIAHKNIKITSLDVTKTTLFPNVLTFVQKNKNKLHSLQISSWTHHRSLDDFFWCVWVCVLEVLVLNKYLTWWGKKVKRVRMCNRDRAMESEDRGVLGCRVSEGKINLRQQQWAHTCLISASPFISLSSLCFILFWGFFQMCERKIKVRLKETSKGTFSKNINCTQILAWANRQSQTWFETKHQTWSAINV